MNFSSPGMGTYGSTWQHAGYSGCGNVVDLLGSATGRPAIVCGNAEGVFQEYETALAKLPDALVFGVNDVGMHLPKLDHWVSLHADRIPNWKAVRWHEHREEGRTWVHSCEEKPCIDYAWDQLNPIFVLSGYFAMQIAWLMGCAPIVLCGCPGMPLRRFFDVTPKQFGYGGGSFQADLNIQEQVMKEMRRVPEFKQVVRSMSGWTETFFGGM